MTKCFFHPTDEPILHFYEDFLEVYQKGERKNKGVYYTPDPVVQFMVESIDKQLKDTFRLPLGLASTKTWKEVCICLNDSGLSGSVSSEHAKDSDFFVRILDPATGTGTFIIKVVKQIRSNLKRYWAGLGWSNEQKITEWNAYVRGTQGVLQDYSGQGLLSRLFAFEVMVAPYCIAHIRLSILFHEDRDLPFDFTPEDETNIFLVNALEHPNRCFGAPNQTLKEKRLRVVKTKVPMTIVLEIHRIWAVPNHKLDYTE